MNLAHSRSAQSPAHSAPSAPWPNTPPTAADPKPLWHLDSVAIEPGGRGRGISSALIEFALEQVRESGVAIVLETGTPRNVPLYERLGFKVVEEADSPEGGPHVWFMRRNPSLARTSDPFSRPTPSTSARSD